MTDQLGTPRMIFDQTGALTSVKRHDYAPFGEELLNGARPTVTGYGTDSTRQKFTLKERDNETGLDYFGARYYASTQGRFTSIDPENYQAMLDPTDPQSWNAYSYVNNNPLRRVDPDGKGFWEKLSNLLDGYGWMTNVEVEIEAQTRREWLSNNYYERDANGKWQHYDASNLSVSDAWTTYDIVNEELAKGRLHALNADELAQAGATSPALKNDPYHPDQVSNRGPEWKALKRQMQEPLAKKYGLNTNSATSQQLLDHLDTLLRGLSVSSVRPVFGQNFPESFS